MKTIKRLLFLAVVILFASCSTLQQATNTTTTGSVFSLTGKWRLTYSNPENTLINSVVTVAPIISQGSLTTVSGNTQCYRENDVKWKNIKSDKNGGYTLDNLLSNCSSGSLNYQPATISVVNTNEIKLTGKDAGGESNEQTWVRVK